MGAILILRGSSVGRVMVPGAGWEVLRLELRLESVEEEEDGFGGVDWGG